MEGLCPNLRRSGKFIQYIRALLFVGAAIGELDRDETAPLVEPTSTDVLLKGAEPNG
jgi:hypothetical protein